MDLYHTIATEYSTLFPSSPEKLHCIEDRLRRIAAVDILDIGCASGEFARQLAHPERRITGIDLDEAMIDEAQQSASGDSSLRFIRAGIMEFLQDSEADTWDALLCLGNTIVYLNGEEQLRVFMQHASRVLRPGGYLAVQLLNYANPEIGPGFVFPLLESPVLTMSRRYGTIETDKGYEFNTEVIEKESDKSIRDLHLHYPFLSTEVKAAALAEGFSRAAVHGDYFDGTAGRDSFFHFLHIWKAT
ncbi:MAG: class I SAM-dependent methyltransferase [Spirochaeta sp.]